MTTAFAGVLARIKSVAAERKERNFLREHRVASREEYRRKYDVRFDKNQRLIKNIYRGYPYFVIVDMALKDYGFHGVDYDREQWQELDNWCKDNCADDYRFDYISVMHGHDGWFITTHPHSVERMFLAFADQGDWMQYQLRWT